ncbi:hypothetical protein M885DRAFT_569653 [Pelagophyceae sp. CCMP2097]|nr:hypothetical protein M885DRAFT_569653 [Pelagophyceae sp. CCMP2097]
MGGVDRRVSLSRLLGGASALAWAPATRARDILDVCPNCQQPIEILPLKTIRGRWSLSASILDENKNPSRRLDGVVSFRGYDGTPNRGQCSFTSGVDATVGSGSWAEKPARINSGQVSWSARWRLKLSDGTQLIFRGDTRTGSPRDFLVSRSAPSIRLGEVLMEVPGAFGSGSVSQKRIGSFNATLVQSWNGATVDEDSKIR